MVPALLLGSHLALVALLEVWIQRGPSRSELPAEGDRFLRALEEHRARHGRYPASLSEAGCVPEWNAFGGWQYEVSVGGASYHLRCGDYSQDYFELYRAAADADWHWDPWSTGREGTLSSVSGA